MSLTKDDKDYIRTYVAEGETEEIQRERRKECVDTFGISLSQVAAITAWTKIRPNLESSKPRTDVPAGTAMDYDNPIKRKYRKTLQNFIAKVFPNIDDRGNKKVLCLPGRQCLEIPVYLELGFLPHNIVGVEYEPTVFSEFLYNASRYGISVRTCELSKVVDEMPWNVINLDFCGNISIDVIQTLKHLRLPLTRNNHEKFFFGMNLLGQRECHSVQRIIDAYYASTKMLDAIAPETDFIEVIKGVKQSNDTVKQNSVSKVLNVPEVELADKRDRAIAMAVSENIGHEFLGYSTTENCGNELLRYTLMDKPQWVDKMASNELATDLIASFFKCLWRGLVAFRMPRSNAVALGHKLMGVYEETIAPHPMITDCGQYSYISPSKQKYLTELYCMEFAPPYGTAAKEVIDFVNATLLVAATKPPEACWFQARDRRGVIHSADDGYAIQANDTLEVVMDGQVVSQLRCKTAVKAADRMIVDKQRDVFMQMMYSGYEFKRIPLDEIS